MLANKIHKIQKIFKIQNLSVKAIEMIALIKVKLMNQREYSLNKNLREIKIKQNNKTIQTISSNNLLINMKLLKWMKH